MYTTTRLAGAICLAAFLLAACAKTDDSAASDTASGATELAPAPATETPAAPATPADEATLVHVPLTEWKVTVSKAVLAPGSTTFHAMNQGAHTHAFEIEGNGEEWKSSPVPPGGTATLTPTLSAGTYEVYCPVVDGQGNHKQRGMRTTFVVR